MKRIVFLAILLIMLSISCYFVEATLFVGFIQCTFMAWGIVIISALFSHRYISYRNNLIAIFSYTLMIIYTLIAIDTFFIHSIVDFGMLRYGMFSAYGIAYIVFVFIGIMLGLSDFKGD